MNKLAIVPFLILGILGCQSNEKRGDERSNESNREWKSLVPIVNQENSTTEKEFEEAISNWPDGARRNAIAMKDRYGLPDLANENLMTWFNTTTEGPWKRVTVGRTGAPHHFPKDHLDVLTQVVDLKVPMDKIEELIKFNGSLLIDRTRGEVSTRCENEEMNLHIINLAREIVEGRMTALQARSNFAKVAQTIVIKDDLGSSALRSSADADQNLIR